jgi:hypothetical protein
MIQETNQKELIWSLSLGIILQAELVVLIARCIQAGRKSFKEDVYERKR